MNLCFILFILFNTWLLKLSLLKIRILDQHRVGWRVYTLNGEGYGGEFPTVTHRRIRSSVGRRRISGLGPGVDLPLGRGGGNGVLMWGGFGASLRFRLIS